jgi:ubiquinone/menaquinone biosynthesis C-methylase UbiE
VVEASARHFERLAGRYSELRASPAYGDPLTRAVVELGSLRGCRVLDVGCGPGTVVCQLAREYGCEAVGIDASPSMIEAARSHAGDCGSFGVARAEDLPFGAESFDSVLMRLAVHHLDRPRAFAEVRRVLRPGGRCVITTTDPEAFDRFWLQPYFPSYAAIDRGRFPDARALEAELGRAGCSDVSTASYATVRRFSREVALEKLRGRAYSTFALMSAEEYAKGVAAAEAALPEEIEYELCLLNVVARRP